RRVPGAELDGGGVGEGDRGGVLGRGRGRVGAVEGVARRGQAATAVGRGQGDRRGTLAPIVGAGRAVARDRGRGQAVLDRDRDRGSAHVVAERVGDHDLELVSPEAERARGQRDVV